MKKVFTQTLTRKKSVGFLPLLGGTCLFLLTSFLVHAQVREVSGSVKDECGQPIAETVVASTSYSATADADGVRLTCSIIKDELNQI